MSYTLDRLFDERPTMIEIIGLEGDLKDEDYLMHVSYEQVAPDKMDGRPGTRFLIGPEDSALYWRISIANQAWAADVIEEDDHGNIVTELTSNEDDEDPENPCTVGSRDRWRVTNFTP